MTISLSPAEFDVNVALRTFLLGVLPGGTKVVKGQVNRVPEPKDSNFVVYTPIRRMRLEMNVDDFVDTKVTASIAGSLMTVTDVAYGTLKAGSLIFGVGMPTGTGAIIVQAQVSGSVGGSAGGTGVYSVAPSGSVSSRTMAAGVLNALQPTELTIQLDVHGPLSADNAQRISTLLRDDYAVQAFKTANQNVVPLTAENRGQIPFINAENQFEDRWVLEACLQVNATVQDIPQQFFDQVVVERLPADIEFVP